MRTNVMRKHRFGKTENSNLQIAHNALNAATAVKPAYYIELATLFTDHVLVSYIDQTLLETGTHSEDDWRIAKISLQNLELHVKLNHFRMLDIYGGDHTAYSWIEENLNTAVKSYLDAGKEVQS